MVENECEYILGSMNFDYVIIMVLNIIFLEWVLLNDIQRFEAVKKGSI